MSKIQPVSLKARLHELADLIASVRKVRIRFDSEDEFLSMLGLQSRRETARYESRESF